MALNKEEFKKDLLIPVFTITEFCTKYSEKKYMLPRQIGSMDDAILVEK